MKSFVAGLLPRWPRAASSRKAEMAAADERAAGMLEMINEATAPFTGGDYFRLLVARLAEQLDVDATLVTECLDYPENHVRTLAYWHGGGFSENIEFDLAGTPCQHVIDDEQFSFYPERLGDHFPEWSEEEGGAESFIGIPVFAPSDGRLVGHIAVYHNEPMRSDAVVESMFRIIAARAGAEIERIQAEKALRDSEARARQHLNELAHVSRVSAMGEMASAVAHEINQPLTAIKTYLQTCIRLLDDENTDPETIRQAMEKSLASAEHSQRIVRKLRDFMKRGEIRRRPIPAARLIRECALLLETEAHHHRVDLDYEIEEDLPMVRVDPVLIQQVLSNLTRNAIDSINDSDRATRRLVLGAGLDGPERVRFRVTDTGKGIDPSIRDKLFEPFVSTRRKGMGIGLSLCQSVIENHGGEMWLEASDDNGATFCFKVPVHDGEDIEVRGSRF